MTRSISGTPTRGVVPGRRCEAQRRPGLVDHVDRAVGQALLAQVPAGQAHRHLEGLGRVGDAVVLLVARPEPLEDLHALGDGRLVDGDLLQAPVQRAVLLDLLELLEGRRPDEAHPALREHRLEQVGQVHRPAAGGAGPDHRVQLVDEEDRLRAPLERRDEGLEALLEVAAKARAGQQRPGVEREDLGAAQRLGGVVGDQALRETLDERGLAHAGLADEDGVVLAAAAEHLERAGDLGQAADERVEFAGARPLREVDREGRERVGGRAGAPPARPSPCG